MRVAGNTNLTLNPCIYLVEGGGFVASGNAGVHGDGVTIFNVGSRFPMGGGSSGAISLSGNGAISLTPAMSGLYAGLVVAQPSSNSQALSFSGNAAAGISGIIDAPSAGLVESGNARLSAAVIVDTLTLGGSASLTVQSSTGGRESRFGA